MKKCVECNKKAKYKCTICLSDNVMYCSVECQRKDYSKHKKVHLTEGFKYVDLSPFSVMFDSITHYYDERINEVFVNGSLELNDITIFTRTEKNKEMYDYIFMLFYPEEKYATRHLIYNYNTMTVKGVNLEYIRREEFLNNFSTSIFGSEFNLLKVADRITKILKEKIKNITFIQIAQIMAELVKTYGANEEILVRKAKLIERVDFL